MDDKTRAVEYANAFKFGKHNWDDLGFVDAYEWLEKAFLAGVAWERSRCARIAREAAMTQIMGPWDLGHNKACAEIAGKIEKGESGEQ